MVESPDVAIFDYQLNKEHNLPGAYRRSPFGQTNPHGLRVQRFGQNAPKSLSGGSQAADAALDETDGALDNRTTY